MRERWKTIWFAIVLARAAVSRTAMKFRVPRLARKAAVIKVASPSMMEPEKNQEVLDNPGLAHSLSCSGTTPDDMKIVQPGWREPRPG